MDETYPSQLIAAFPDEDSASDAARHIGETYGLDHLQFTVFPPTAVGAGKIKVVAGCLATGISVGLLTAVAVIAWGDKMAVAQPGLTMLVLAAHGALVGLAFAGLLLWRHRRLSHLGGGTVPAESSSFLLRIEMHDLAQQYEVREAFHKYPGISIRVTFSGYMSR
jgi:hypothetical protein